MNFREAIRRSQGLFRPETPAERTLRVEGQITDAQVDTETDPNLREFAERYGNFAGHALMLARPRVNDNDIRDIHSDAARLFTKSLQSGNYGNVETGFRLLADMGSDVIIRPPLEGTYP